MKKMLVTTSVASMVDQFLLPSICLMQRMGYEVHVGCNFLDGNTCSAEKTVELKKTLASLGVAFHQIDFARKVSRIAQHGVAYRQLRRLIRRERFELVHCHSPIGGFLTRLACRGIRRRGGRVIYTAHGFHFYKGAPKKNWVLYYSAEKLCARYTDVLVTINKEDYELAKKKLRVKRVEYVPGVGVNTEKFSKCTIDPLKKRQELGIPEDAFLMLSVGELNDNKNHETVIRALAIINDRRLYYVIAGQGARERELLSIAEFLGVKDRVQLLGFRKDAAELYHASDVFVFPSFREGLSVSLMEAMASGLPVLASCIRGNTDLVEEEGGALFDPFSPSELAEKICEILMKDRDAMGAYNKEKVRLFGEDAVLSKMREIYKA